MVGYLIAAPTVVAAARFGLAPERAKAAIPTVQPVDHYDLSHILTEAALPTMPLLTVTVNPGGSASFQLPRAEVGQGITTAPATPIAGELDLPIAKLHA